MYAHCARSTLELRIDKGHRTKQSMSASSLTNIQNQRDFMKKKKKKIGGPVASSHLETEKGFSAQKITLLRKP